MRFRYHFYLKHSHILNKSLKSALKSAEAKRPDKLGKKKIQVSRVDFFSMIKDNTDFGYFKG